MTFLLQMMVHCKICRESSNGINNLPRKIGSNGGNIKKSRYSKLKQLFLVTVNKSLTLYRLLNGEKQLQKLTLSYT